MPLLVRAARSAVVRLLVLACVAAAPSVVRTQAPATSTSPISAQKPDPAAVLAAAREALGGDKRLSAVRSFVASGRTRQVQGENLVPIEFEISCELPDKYIRRDEIPARESGPTTIGFNGDALIQVPEPPTPPARAGAPGWFRRNRISRGSPSRCSPRRSADTRSPSRMPGKLKRRRAGRTRSTSLGPPTSGCGCSFTRRRTCR
jgi:hypothetical protein